MSKTENKNNAPGQPAADAKAATAAGASAHLTEREKIRRWAAAWRSAAPAMEALRHEHLAAMGNEPNFDLIESLLDCAKFYPDPNPECGLVEQQELFMKVARLAGRSRS